jgi:hypothetical protein
MRRGSVPRHDQSKVINRKNITPGVRLTRLGQTKRSHRFPPFATPAGGFFRGENRRSETRRPLVFSNTPGQYQLFPKRRFLAKVPRPTKPAPRIRKEEPSSGTVETPWSASDVLALQLISALMRPLRRPFPEQFFKRFQYVSNG